MIPRISRALETLLTFRFLRNFPTMLDGNDRLLQNFFIHRRHLIKMVAIFFLSCCPRKVYVTDFRWNHREVAIKSRISQEMGNTTIFNSKYSQRISAQKFHLLFRDPNRQIGRWLVMSLILMIMSVMMRLEVLFMSSENDPKMKKNVEEDQKHRKRSHYECLESIDKLRKNKQ